MVDDMPPPLPENADLVGMGDDDFRYRLVVIQTGVRRVDHLEPGFARPKTEIRIVKRHREIDVVQPADGLEHCAVDEGAGESHSADVANNVRQIEVAGMLTRQSLEHMDGARKRAEDHARVLNCVVWIEKFGADDADVWPPRNLDHSSQ